MTIRDAASSKHQAPDYVYARNICNASTQDHKSNFAPPGPKVQHPVPKAPRVSFSHAESWSPSQETYFVCRVSTTNQGFKRGNTLCMPNLDHRPSAELDTTVDGIKLLHAESWPPTRDSARGTHFACRILTTDQRCSQGKHTLHVEFCPPNIELNILWLNNSFAFWN